VGEAESKAEDEDDNVGVGVSLELILEEDDAGVADDEAGTGLDEGFWSMQLMSYHSYCG
jgi:hypothetical protein